MKLQEPLVIQYVGLLVKKLRQAAEKKTSVDMVEWINFTTFDIISDLGWSASLGCLEKQEYHPWVTVILQFKTVLIANSIAYYPLLNTLVPYITPKSALAGLNMIL